MKMFKSEIESRIAENRKTNGHDMIGMSIDYYFLDFNPIVFATESTGELVRLTATIVNIEEQKENPDNLVVDLGLDYQTQDTWILLEKRETSIVDHPHKAEIIFVEKANKDKIEEMLKINMVPRNDAVVVLQTSH
jgi:hypothetical protein